MHASLGYMKERQVHKARWEGALVAHDSLPWILIDGPADPVSGAHLAAAVEGLVAASGSDKRSVVSLPANIGHYPQVEAPEAVLREALRFWDQYLT